MKVPKRQIKLKNNLAFSVNIKYCMSSTVMASGSAFWKTVMSGLHTLLLRLKNKQHKHKST